MLRLEFAALTRASLQRASAVSQQLVKLLSFALLAILSFDGEALANPYRLFCDAHRLEFTFYFRS